MKLNLRTFVLLVIAILGFPSQGFTTLFTADLDGASESPPNGSLGTGFAEIELDTLLHTLDIEVTFSDLLGTTTAAHIHGNTDLPGTGVAAVLTEVPSFEGFPLGVTSGTYSHTFDTTLESTWNPAFLAIVGSPLSAETALESFLVAGTAYFNIHTTEFTLGEIRGFAAAVPEPEPIPEPATLFLFGSGIVGLIGNKIRKMKR